MFSTITYYWKWISRPFGPSGEPQTIEIHPNVMYDCLPYLFGFLLIGSFIKYYAQHTTWYSSLSSRKKRELPSYGICLIHHMILVPRAFYSLWIDWNRPFPLTTADHHQLANEYIIHETPIAKFSLAYLAADTLLYAIPATLVTCYELYQSYIRHDSQRTMKKSIDYGGLEFLTHHLLSMSLVLSALSASGYIARFIPHLIICETPNICFTIAWFIRTITGVTAMESTFVWILELSFAILYLLIRVINLPIAMFSLLILNDASSMGPGRFVLGPLIFLQWYWFSKIAKNVMERLKPKHMKENRMDSVNSVVDLIQDEDIMRQAVRAGKNDVKND